jgi:hypothetical protein
MKGIYGSSEDALVAKYSERIEALEAEAERLRIENIQLKFACGYPMPADLERHIIPDNPFKCGTCDAYREARHDCAELVRRLDVALNGDGAAKQASLCDIVSQVEAEHRRRTT